MGHVAGRIVAGLGAAALWLGSLAVGIIALFVAASAAEPGVGNPRGETLASGLALGLFGGILLGGATVLTVYAVAGRFAGWPWLVGVPLACTLALGLLAGATL